MDILREDGVSVHSGQLARATTSNLLHSQRAQLGLEVIELPLQVVLVLSPKVLGLDSGGVRLSRSSAFVQREALSVVPS